MVSLEKLRFYFEWMQWGVKPWEITERKCKSYFRCENGRRVLDQTREKGSDPRSKGSEWIEIRVTGKSKTESGNMDEKEDGPYGKKDRKSPTGCNIKNSESNLQWRNSSNKDYWSRRNRTGWVVVSKRSCSGTKQKK